MQSDLFNCSICFNQFDQKERKPKILPKCGHTICLFCLENILKANQPKCPLDRQPLETNLESFATNILLLQLIDEKSKITSERCSFHNEQNNLICMDDKCRICKYCADYGDHKNHKIKHINDVQKLVNVKRRELESMMKDIETEEQNLKNSLEEKKMRSLQANSEKFAFLKELLIQKEEEIRAEIEIFFMLEELELSKSLREHQISKQDLKTRLSSLNDNEIGQVFFKTLEWGDTKREPKEDLNESISKEIKEFDLGLNEKLKRISDAVIQQLSQFEERIKIEGFESMMKIEEMSKKLFKFEVKDERLVISPAPELKEENSFLFSPEFMNSKVTLNLKKAKITEEMIQGIYFILQKIGRVGDLKVDLSNQDLTSEVLVSCCSVFMNLSRDAEILELLLTGCSSIDDKSMIEIFNEAQCCMKKLNGIKLQVRGTKITDESINALSQLIYSRRESIEVFYLNAAERPITDTSIEKLCRSFKAEMKYFALILNSTKIRDRSIEVLVEHILPLSSRWETFCFHFFWTVISDHSLEKFLQALKDKVSSLKCLTFDIGKTKASSKSVQLFIESVLPCLNNNLEKLQLSFGLLQLDEAVIDRLLRALNKKIGENLKLFALSLDKNRVVDSHIKYLKEEILVRFKTLEHLLLTLASCSLTDASVAPLFASFGSLSRNMKHLTIRLNSNSEITDKSFEEFNGNVFAQLTSLETFCVQVNSTKVSEGLKKSLAEKEQFLLMKQ